MTAITTAETPTKRRRALVVGLAAAVLTAGIAGAAFQTTGAWFTATKTSPGNTVTAGTLSIGELGDGANGLVEAVNAFPMTDEQAKAATSTAATAVINVRNTGTLPLDYDVKVTNPTITKAEGVTGTPDLSKVKVAYQVGGAWTTTTLSNFVASPPAALLRPGTDLAPDETAAIALRVYFDSTAGNEFQGATVRFNATVDAIQVNYVP